MRKQLPWILACVLALGAGWAFFPSSGPKTYEWRVTRTSVGAREASERDGLITNGKEWKLQDGTVCTAKWFAATSEFLHVNCGPVSLALAAPSPYMTHSITIGRDVMSFEAR